MASSTFVTDRINARFNDAHPSNDLCLAGVLIHAFDGHLDPHAPWQVSTNGWMATYSRVLSASIISSRKAGVFNTNGGVVLAPTSTLLCSYPYDGGAMNYANGCGPSTCSEPTNIYGCSFPPSMTYRMLQIHERGRQWPYNEAVIDGAGLVIEAVYGGAAAAGVHAQLLAHFGVSRNQLPLLVYRGGARDPFQLA